MEILPDETNSYPMVGVGDTILSLMLKIQNYQSLKDSLILWCKTLATDNKPLLTTPQCFEDLISMYADFVELLQFQPTFSTLTVYETTFGTLSPQDFIREENAQRLYLTKARKAAIESLYSRIPVITADLSDYYVIATHHGATRSLMAREY